MALERMVVRLLGGFFAGAALLHAGAALAAIPESTLGSGHADPEAAACAELTGAQLGEGASVLTATALPAGPLQISDQVTVPGLPGFCRVEGVSRPTPDSNIRFEVWLPSRAAWNRKFLSAGEGGFAGHILYSVAGLDGAMDGNLRRGYATASTDTGHEGADLHFAIGHPERGIDYLRRAKHLTTVAAKEIIAKYYGSPPARSYYNSCSNGGREGLLEAQLYPADFDGLIIGAPWILQSRSTIGHLWMRRLLSQPGAEIPADKLPMVHAAVLKACDEADGLADGVINNPASCRFDPKVLECKGADGPNCLTPAQVSSLASIYQGPRDLRDGSSIFPGFAKGSEMNNFGRPDTVQGLPEQFFTNFVNKDPKWDPLTFDISKDEAATLEAGRIGDAGSTDYEAAKKRGVKIIQYHGWNDPGIPPGSSVRYYNQVVAANGGLTKTEAFYRLFMVPGMGHCFGGVGASSIGGVGQQPPPVRDETHDLVTALENWVEHGIAPSEFIATKYASPAPTATTVQFQRRLCMYPAVARYKGAGDTNDAANFSCVKQEPVSPSTH